MKKIIFLTFMILTSFYYTLSAQTVYSLGTVNYRDTVKKNTLFIGWSQLNTAIAPTVANKEETDNVIIQYTYKSKGFTINDSSYGLAYCVGSITGVPTEYVIISDSFTIGTTPPTLDSCFNKYWYISASGKSKFKYFGVATYPRGGKVVTNIANGVKLGTVKANFMYPDRK